MATSPQGGPSVRRKLDSWKEIAGYLNVSVRTVQRWEAQGQLPVHRIQRDRGAAVFAFTDEIDEWFHSRVQSPDEANGTDRVPEASSQRSPLDGPTSKTLLELVPADSSVGPRIQPRPGRWLMAGTAAAVLAAILLAWFYGKRPIGPLTSQPLTVEPGAEWSPVLSPDSRKLLFVRSRGDEFGVAYQSPPGGKVQHLTRGRQMEFSPQWLPDSRRFVWLRFLADFRAELWVGSLDHPEQSRAVAAVNGVLWLDPIRFGPYLQVLPGGEAVVVAGQAGPRGPASIDRVDLKTGRVERLRTDARRIQSIAVSPDGSRLLAVSAEGGQSSVDEFRLTSDGRLSGGPSPVSQSATAIAWKVSGDPVFLAIDGLPPPEVPQRAEFTVGRGWWRRLIHLSDRLPLAATFSVGIDGYLYWSDLRFDSSMRRWDAKSGHLTGPVCDSSTMERMPSLSPDGKHLAFVSNRAGGTNIFTCDLDQGEVTPITRYADSLTWRPKWSPDGREVGYVVNEISGLGRVETAPIAGGAATNWSAGMLGRPEDYAWVPGQQGLYILTGSKIFRRPDPEAAPVHISDTTASCLQPRADGKIWLLDQEQLALWDPQTGDRQVMARSISDLGQLDLDGRSIFAARKSRPGPFGTELWRYTDSGSGTRVAPDLPMSLGWHGGPHAIALAVIAEQTEAAIYRAGPLK